MRLKIQEFAILDIDVDTNVALKHRELERIKSELKTIARDTEETQNELKAITEKLDYEEWKLKQIDAGLSDLEAGRVISHDEMIMKIERKIGAAIVKMIFGSK